jgi:hypothetical protein
VFSWSISISMEMGISIRPAVSLPCRPKTQKYLAGTPKPKTEEEEPTLTLQSMTVLLLLLLALLMPQQPQPMFKTKPTLPTVEEKAERGAGQAAGRNRQTRPALTNLTA